MSDPKMEKKDMSMETRLLLAFLLMGLVLFGTQYFYKPAAAPANSPTKSGPIKPAEVAKQTEKTPPPQPAPTAEVPGQVHADQEETFTIKTDVFRVTFSNRGAVVRSWILKAYKDHKDKPQPLELVDQLALAKTPAPFSLSFKNQQPATDPNNALFQATRSPDNLSVDFEFSDGRAVTKKSFKFSKTSYLVGVTTEVAENGTLIPHSIEWRGGFGDETVVNAVSEQRSVYYDLSAGKLQEK